MASTDREPPDGWPFSRLYRGLREAVLPVVISRLALVVVAIVALTLFDLDSDARAADRTAHPWINAFVRWDATFYESIARDGYEFDPAARWSNVAFFPLYPLLMRAVALPLGGDPAALVTAGVLISNVALLVGVGYLWALASREFGRNVASASVVALLVFPMTYVFSAVRPDGLFLALAAGSLYHARTERWWLAGSLAAGAALTRANGILILLPLLVEWFADADRRSRWLRPELIALALPPLALSLFAVYLAVEFGDPLIWLAAEEKWGRALDLSLDALLHMVPIRIHGFRNSLIDVLFALFYLGLAALAWRRLRPSLALFATITVVLPFLSGSLSSMPRYGAVAFPLFMVLGIAFTHSRRMERAYILVALPLAGSFMAMFALWYWIA